MWVSSTDPSGRLLLVFVDVDVEAVGEEVQLGNEPLVHGNHVVLLLGQRGVVPQQAHAIKKENAFINIARTTLHVSGRRCVFSPTWQLSGPVAGVASPPSESGWCATPGHKSSSEGCKPVRAWGQTLQKHWRIRQNQSLFASIPSCQFVTANE